jgi:hypothetical protein
MTPKGATKRILAPGRTTSLGKVRDDFRIAGDVEKNTAGL